MRTLSFEEVESVAGGDSVSIGPITVNLQQVAVGLAIIALSATIVGTGGIAAAPAAVALSSFLGAAGVAGAAGGGLVVGSAMQVTAPGKDDKSGGS